MESILIFSYTLKEEKILVEIAKENGITPNNLKNWKKIF